jgi:hypothetical protein
MMGLIAHGGHISTTSGAAAHDHRNLRNALRAHIGLVKEYAAKVIAVGKYFVLIRQVGPTGIDQVNTWQVVFSRYFLRAQVFLHAQGVISTAFNRGVVAHNHAIHATDTANACNGSRARCSTTVHAPRSQGCQFQKR